MAKKENKFGEYNHEANNIEEACGGISTEVVEEKIHVVRELANGKAHSVYIEAFEQVLEKRELAVALHNTLITLERLHPLKHMLKDED